MPAFAPHYRPLASALVCALSLLMLTTACPARADELVLQAAQLKAQGIELAASSDSSRLRSATWPAQVVVPTAQMRVVTAPVAGVIESLLVAPGERVRRDQPLARLASRELLELQRDVAQASSQASLLRQALNRDEQLFAEGLIAESRLQATRAAATQAQALASERQQGLNLTGSRASNGPNQLTPGLNINAPLTGVVLEQLVHSGQRVDAATPLYRVAKLNPLWLEIQVPLASVGELQPGQRLQVSSAGVSAKVLGSSRVLDPASQSVLVRAEVSQGAERLLPGQMLSVELPQTTGHSQRLPASALIREGERTWVFKRSAHDPKSGEQRFVAVPVRVLSQGGDSVTVDGLQGDEMLVVRGASALKAIRNGVGRE